MQFIRFLVEFGYCLTDCQRGTLFKYIVYPPQIPHALGKMRVKMAMENRVTHGFIAISGTAIGNFIGIA
jgi:hypothetical protein